MVMTVPRTSAAFPAVVLVLACLVAFAAPQPAIAADERVVIKMPPELDFPPVIPRADQIRTQKMSSLAMKRDRKSVV